ncbi:hypothetical protein [Herbiconiux sp. A18JL235]|uniref:DUF11 domain-containing protein n=1 Tax=Herbiconiux sp. A18JL235 TaxID=3152363 RepID=A0AB39BID4_9MICO
MSDLTRRTLIGTVWAAPVIVAAAAAPLAAASTGPTIALGIAANPGSVIIHRGTSLRQTVEVTVTNNTGRATQGVVSVSMPYQAPASGIFIADFPSVTGWSVTIDGGTAVLQTLTPLADGASISFTATVESQSASPDWNFRTGQTIISVTVSTPGAASASLPLWAATVPES